MLKAVLAKVEGVPWESNFTSMAFDRNGNLYVANSGNHTVVKFDSHGTPSTFASTGLSTPYGLAVAPPAPPTVRSNPPIIVTILSPAPGMRSPAQRLPCGAPPAPTMEWPKCCSK